MSLGFGDKATFQLCRTQRWLDRLGAICGGEYRPLGTWDDPLDYVLAFYLNCYHVKDWLKRDPKWQEDVPKKLKSAAVEQFINETEALCICADLCNGNKHFRLRRAPRSGSSPEFLGEHTRIDHTTEPAVTSRRYSLKTARGRVDAYELAVECLQAWRRLVRESTPDSLKQLADRNKRDRTG
ncbi:MAG: hypothetical protein ACLQBJ_00310 [Bryobacteraceae bacterium]